MAYWWGIHRSTVAKWRKALEVTRTNNEGTHRLVLGTIEASLESRFGPGRGRYPYARNGPARRSLRNFALRLVWNVTERIDGKFPRPACRAAGSRPRASTLPMGTPLCGRCHGMPRLRMSRSVPEPFFVDNAVGRLSLLSPQQTFRSSPFSS